MSGGGLNKPPPPRWVKHSGSPYVKSVPHFKTSEQSKPAFRPKVRTIHEHSVLWSVCLTVCAKLIFLTNNCVCWIDGDKNSDKGISVTFSNK